MKCTCFWAKVWAWRDSFTFYFGNFIPSRYRNDSLPHACRKRQSFVEQWCFYKHADAYCSLSQYRTRFTCHMFVNQSEPNRSTMPSNPLHVQYCFIPHLWSNWNNCVVWGLRLRCTAKQKSETYSRLRFSVCFCSGLHNRKVSKMTNV